MWAAGEGTVRTRGPGKRLSCPRGPGAARWENFPEEKPGGTKPATQESREPRRRCHRSCCGNREGAAGAFSCRGRGDTQRLGEDFYLWPGRHQLEQPLGMTLAGFECGPLLANCMQPLGKYWGTWSWASVAPWALPPSGDAPCPVCLSCPDFRRAALAFQRTEWLRSMDSGTTYTRTPLWQHNYYRPSGAPPEPQLSLQNGSRNSEFSKVTQRVR